MGGLERFGSPALAATEPPKELTQRERQVLELLVAGLSNRQIADMINLSENTTRKHLRNILEKLHLNNRVEAAVYAVKQGLVV
jgi:DNA-binding NarL/FixJ family response regulator